MKGFSRQRLWRYVYLNAGLKIYYNKILFSFFKRVFDLLSNELDGNSLYEPIYYKDQHLNSLFPISIHMVIHTTPL